VIITFVLVTGKPEPKPAAVASTVEITPTPLPAPVVVVSMPVVPAVSVARPTLPPPTAAPVFVAAVPSATPPPVVAAVAIPNIPARGAPTESIKAPSAPLSRGERIQSFIDGLRVTGVRAAGSDSKALVDGHVYRVNDMLDRALGLRLVQVDADHLTLVDSGGVTYIKSF
jgi:hypothetical protein